MSGRCVRHARSRNFDEEGDERLGPVSGSTSILLVLLLLLLIVALVGCRFRFHILLSDDSNNPREGCAYTLRLSGQRPTREREKNIRIQNMARGRLPQHPQASLQQLRLDLPGPPPPVLPPRCQTPPPPLHRSGSSPLPAAPAVSQRCCCWSPVFCPPVLSRSLLLSATARGANEIGNIIQDTSRTHTRAVSAHLN